jgi:hypothetical protein
VITIPQYTGTCWFNALMMSLFYSEGMRQILFDKLASWKRPLNKPQSIIRDILENNYIRKDNNFIKFFNEFKPEVLLKELHVLDPRVFDFNPEIHDGYSSTLYKHKLLIFLGISNFSILHNYKGSLYYAFLELIRIRRANNEMQVRYHKADDITSSTPDLSTKDVIIIICNDNVRPIDTRVIKRAFRVDRTLSFDDTRFNVDSMMLTNFNQLECKKGHEIAGVSCEKERFIYNGWIGISKDQGINGKMFNEVPCTLMKHDWMDKEKTTFCIDKTRCSIKSAKDDKTEVCFNFSKGNRTYVYIRDDLQLPKTPSKPQTVVGPGDKVLSPNTDGCDSKAGKIGKEIRGSQKRTKTLQNVCPDDKVWNPETSRCVTKTGKIGKKILESQKQTKTPPTSQNVCPDDKVLNPKTNRCVSKTGKIGKKILSMSS